MQYDWPSERQGRSEGRVVSPPKSVRQQAGFEPGDEVTYEAREGRIEVQRVPTLRESFMRKKFAKISFEKFEELTPEVLSPG